MSYYDNKVVEFRPLQDKKGNTYWEAFIRQLDMGGKVTVHDAVGKNLVLKVTGHKYSLGWGITEYQPAHYIAFKTKEPIKLDKMYPTQAEIESFVLQFPVTSSKG